jgi:hypothetical protein
MSRRSGAASRSSRSEGAQSKLEKLNVEAENILNQKKQELVAYQNAIDEAEQTLAKLKTEFESNAALMSAEAEGDRTDAEEPVPEELIDIEKLKASQDAEIQQMTAKHEEELAGMRARYAASLKEAEGWAEAHAENVYLERLADFENLKKELELSRRQANEVVFAQTQSRTRLFQQGKSASLQNAQRIQELENQLSELASITREELRDVRAKIDECLASIDVRELEHRSEIEKYQREFAQREEQYNAHLEILAEQFQQEKQRLEQQFTAASSKGENLRRVRAQLQKHHDMQIATTRKDNERMKLSIYQAKARDDQQFVNTKGYVSQIQNIQRTCGELEQELQLVNKEISELQDESRELQSELQGLDMGSTSRAISRRR